MQWCIVHHTFTRCGSANPAPAREPEEPVQGWWKGAVLQLSCLLQEETETKIFKGRKPRLRHFSETFDLYALLQLSLMGKQIWAGAG